MTIDPKELEALAREDVAKGLDVEEGQLLDVQLWGVLSDKAKKLIAKRNSVSQRRQRLLEKIAILQAKENRLKWQEFSLERAFDRLDERAGNWEKKHSNLKK